MDIDQVVDGATSRPVRRRAFLVAAVVASAAAAGGALLLLKRPPDGLEWTGGPVTPSPVPITFNPSAMPVGDTVPTGIVLDGRELVLFLWGTGSTPYLSTAWRELSTGQAGPEGPWSNGAFLEASNGFTELSQIVLTDGTLVEFGLFGGAAEKIVCEDHGSTVEARFARWSHDRSLTILWLHRRGEPVPENSPVWVGRSGSGSHGYPLRVIAG